MKQFQIRLKTHSRGFHLVTDEIMSQISTLPKIGLLHLFIQHTSAGICINENTDPTVLLDLNDWFNKNIKENETYYRHIFEGSDDMPAHIKSILTGTDLTIPITDSKLALGIWQGIYLAEFRNNGGPRNILASIIS